ncbi:metal ABC transporter permease [Anaeroselena agilis]|uniref:Metal ABC transporter permease n=1 Tax=Anaeroselena agilis TaxID=3063788 RepID=A0ABU3NZY7_9FIRM|nr:metal ABC transporter permease [Selenomonadales bacterium 4137-cl]
MDFLSYDFMQRAMAAGLITAVVCPLIGMFVVVRRQALIGDGLGHIAFAGVMGGYLLGVYPTAAAAAVTMLGAGAVEFIRHRHAHHADTALAIMFYTGIALAVIFSSMARTPGTNLLGVLFGSILTVTGQDLILIVACGLVVAAAVGAFFDRLALVAFDEETAHVAGINTSLVGILLSVLTALVVVVGMRVVGILLVSALMVVPVAAAHLLRRGFRATLAWAVAFSVFAVAGGLALSFYLDIAPGGTIVITAVAVYIAVLLTSGRSVGTGAVRRCSGAAVSAGNEQGDK